MRYALIFECQELQHPSSGEIMTCDGEKVWLVGATESLPGYPTSKPYTPEKFPPKDLITFGCPEDAREFAIKWGGHPWWIKPKPGVYEIVEVEPVYKKVRAGWLHHVPKCPQNG